MLQSIKTTIVGLVRTGLRWGGRTLVSLILFFTVRKIFPWPFRRWGMNMTRKYGPGMVRAARPYAERGMDKVTGTIRQVRGHTMQPVVTETMPDVQPPAY